MDVNGDLHDFSSYTIVQNHPTYTRSSHGEDNVSKQLSYGLVAVMAAAYVVWLLCASCRKNGGKKNRR